MITDVRSAEGDRVGVRVVLASTLLGLATAAVVLLVDPPAHGAALDLPVFLVPGSPPVPAPDVAAEASSLLGGTPTAVDLAATTSVDLTDGLLTVRARAASNDEAVVITRALATAAARRIAQATAAGRPVNRPAVVIGDAEPRITGREPHPGTVLAAGALLGLLPGLVALRRRPVPDAGSGRLPRSRRDPVVLTRGTGRRHAARVAATRRVAGSLREGRVIAVVEETERAAVSAVVSTVMSTATSATVSAAVEIATALAHDGARVLLVEAGPRSPSSRVRRIADPSPGVREVLAGVAETDRAIRPWERGGLDVLPTGRSGPPLADEDVAAVLEPLRDRYDHVVLDAPGPADLVVTVRGTRVAAPVSRPPSPRT